MYRKYGIIYTETRGAANPTNRWKGIKMERTKGMRMTYEQIKSLESIGFRRWTKYGKDRLYATAEAVGLSCTYYGTGNISSASLNGERISNSHARAVSGYIDGVYVDIETSRISYRDERGRDLVNDAIERV